jgi:hypothetical protein
MLEKVPGRLFQSVEGLLELKHIPRFHESSRHLNKHSCLAPFFLAHVVPLWIFINRSIEEGGSIIHLSGCEIKDECHVVPLWIFINRSIEEGGSIIHLSGCEIKDE